MKKTILGLFAGLFVLMMGVWLASPCMAAKKVYEIKLSVDSNMNHHRNRGVKVFQAFLERNSKGRLKFNFFHSAQLYKDRDIPKALKLGTVDMALPGIWNLEGIDPNMGITGLPMFFGLPEDITKKLVDEQVGEKLNAVLEKKIDVVIPGRWYFHGYLNACSTQTPLTSINAFKGLKIRHMGGASSALRIHALGGTAVMIPWPDLPMAVVQGTCDGLVTTYRSFMSAKLWDAGVKYSVKDKQYYLHYIPLVSGKFWNKLPEDLKKIFLNTWEEHIDIARAISDFEQKRGEDVMKANGVSIYYPPDAELAEWRKQVMTIQDQVVKETGMDPALVKSVEEAVTNYLK